MHHRSENGNSWYFCKPIEECHTLFDGEPLGLWAHFFHCRCGKQEACLSREQNYTYRCSECANELFLERGILREPALYDSVDIICEYREEKGGLKGIAYIDVPADADFLRKKIVYEKHIIAEIFRKHTGSTLLSPKSFDRVEIIDRLKRGMADYALESYGDNTLLRSFGKNTLDTDDKLSVIFFAIRYPGLKSAALYFWSRSRSLKRLYDPPGELRAKEALLYLLNGRKERSVRRALFERHNELERVIEKIGTGPDYSIDTIESFYPASIFVICRTFRDPNVATRLIRKKAFFHPNETNSIKLNDTIWLIIFLKKHYSEVDIAALLLTTGKDPHLWTDTVRMAATHKRAIRREFKRVKLSIAHLHDAFASIMRSRQTKRDKALKLVYTERQKQACIEVEALEFKLPRTGSELYEWGEALHNCMYAYLSSIAEKETVIYAVFKDNRIVYAVEVSNGSIVQALSKYNKEVSPEDGRVIGTWFEKTYKMEEEEQVS